jgi:hypothetical protein
MPGWRLRCRSETAHTGSRTSAMREAMAELMHQKARGFCGYRETGNLEMMDIIRE